LEETPRKRRDRLYIISEVLTIAKEGTLKTQIMYKANLSFAQLNEYISFLVKIKLLEVITEDDKTIYKTTAKGIRYLQNYEKIASLLDEEKNSATVNSPVFWLKRTQ
jgi:predicted transcriptional regulator